MPSSDDADKKKRSPVPLTRQDTSALPPTDNQPEGLPSEATSTDEPARGLPPGDATAELSQEQLDELPALQRHEPASTGPGTGEGGPASVDSDAWGSFEENNAWMAASQTGRRWRQDPASSGPGEVPPTQAFLGGPPEPSVVDEDAADRVVPARLVSVQAAGGKRQEFVLRVAQVRLGRGSTNQIVIDNPSVSREHARFTWQRGQWTVHDLQSGNGVFVNQQRIARARALQHGDEVMFGQTLWQFAVESVGLPAMPASPTLDVAPPSQDKGRRITYVLLAGVVLLGIGLLVPNLRSRWQHRQPDPDAAALAALHEGIAAFKAHKWDVAEHEFAKVAMFNPQDGLAKRLQKAMERERAAEQQLQQAREAQSKGDLVAAYQLTTGVLDSTFRHEAQIFLAALQSDLDTRVQQAQSALDAGQLSVARELLQSVEEAQPGRPDVTIMQVRLALRTSSAKTPVHLAALGKNRQMPPLSGPTAMAVRYFIDGDVPKALQMLESLNSEEAATTRQAVQRFSDAYDAGLADYHSKKPTTAIRYLNQAKVEEARISHGQCKLVNTIDPKLADMYYVQGLQQFMAGSWPAAYQSFRMAVTLVPSHGFSSRKLAELDQKAQDILAGTGANRATRMQLQLVLQIVPVGSDLYRKAKSRLDALP
jgi:pSer/pThr/pTyr-binding forkhead associated (FHA) protein/tetratricopeptide (TPR) repeat protein